MDGAGLSLNDAVVRYFYLKQVTSYAGTSSMVLLLHDFCAYSQASASFACIPHLAPPTVITFSQEVSAKPASKFDIGAQCDLMHAGGPGLGECVRTSVRVYGTEHSASQLSPWSTPKIVYLVVSIRSVSWQ